ncbi:MAG TPA: CHAT domain-containing protein [Microbacterium sp.]|nr:CHAT domain-containing protein [Microbacterium sp.]
MSAIIELEIGPGEEPGAWEVRVLRSAGADTASASFRLDVDTLITRLPFMDSTVLASAVPARRVLTEGETEIQRVGTELFAAVFSGEVEEAYRTSRAVAKERGESLQVRLRLVAPTLAALPWESLYDPEAGVYVCRKEPLIRQIPTTDAMEPLSLDPPLRVLAMVAAPSDLAAIDAKGERKRLETALGPHIARGRILVEWLDDVTWANVHEKLLSAPWHVLHFVGHGSYDSSSDEGVLAFVGSDGRAEYVDASALADLLDQAEPTPRLVVINSCMSGTSSTDELYSGTAAALVNSGINAVAAMQFTISDAAAVAFSQGFYSALAYGRRIDEAVVSGRIAILGLGRDTLEWVTPVLCLRGDDTRLFILPPSAAGVEDMPEFPEPPPEPGPTPDPRRIGLIAGVAAGAALLLGIGGTVAVITALSGGGGGGGDGGTGSGNVAAVTLPAQIDVGGNTVWTPTGLDCTGGQRLLLTATGEVEVEDLGGLALTPEGAQQQYSAIDPQPYASHASLIGRVSDSGMPFVVGSRLAMECPIDGDIQLGFNDSDPGGNVGSFTVAASDVTEDPTITLDALTPLTVDVPASAGEWVPTGITCLPGAAYSVWGNGVITWGEDQQLTAVDADGTEVFTQQANDPSDNVPSLEDAEHGSLIGSIDGLPPYVELGTESYFDCYAGGGRIGQVVLGVNDLARDDNTGQFTVTMSRITPPSG